ncbi:hypothetical protein K0M31_019730 [Melipona bicolor]|uniref:Uncharacterized protein n=1 Tax=Melipona bicolor TaxID=60889 RepID=A0AA40G2Y6_9HYME|nr:hypothetical protein K0M31_019730 [Melipona bicolor]
MENSKQRSRIVEENEQADDKNGERIAENGWPFFQCGHTPPNSASARRAFLWYYADLCLITCSRNTTDGFNVNTH